MTPSAGWRPPSTTRKGNFVGTFDPRLDSLRDVNYTAEPIDLGDYVANPDHKSIPVREVPEHYWQCLVFLEDRNLGGLLNPFGIDLGGVLKIPALHAPPLDRGAAPEPRHRRLDAGRCSSCASSTRRRRAPTKARWSSSSASSANGGSPPSSIAS